MNAARAMKTLKRSAFVAVFTCAVAAGFHARAGNGPGAAQDHLQPMTNSATWFAREAGLFERHGLTADLIYVDSTPAVQALTAGQAPLATMSGGLAVGPYLNGLDLVMLAGWCI